jgi:hypothetical protein
VRAPKVKAGAALWTELYDASPNQLIEEISKEQGQIISAGKTVRLQSMEKLRDYIVPRMEGKLDDPMGPMLDQLAKERGADNATTESATVAEKATA